MNNPTDQQLLRDYVGLRSEPAFAALVRRHVDFVYSVALRMVRNAHLAEDVTQDVFVALAQNARPLTERPVLSGWLHRTARNLAANAIRSDVRRRVREQDATTMNELLSATPDVPWEHIAPQLDAALDALSESDRDAVLLRYFERKSAQEMAQILGLSGEAAQKRVNRAVERLRDYFSKRNLTIGASGLAIALTAHGVQAAPVALADTVAAFAAAAGTAVRTSTFITATKSIAMTTIQKTFITAAVAIVAGAGIYEARQANQWREQNRALQQQQATLSAQIQQLQRERDGVANQMASLLAENAQMKQGQNTAELLKLRGEVGQLRQQLQGLPSARAALLKQKLAAAPERGIPELKLLKQQDWENVSWNADLDSDDGVRVALRDARNKAVDTFFNLAREAIRAYLAANNDILPSDLLPLKPYFSVPVTDDMLQRYAFMQTGALNWSQDLVNEVAPSVDDNYDSSSRMSMNGASGSCWNKVRDAVAQAEMAFSVDNNGQPPTDPSQLESYLNMTIDPAAMQKYFGQIASDLAAKLPPAETATLAPAIKAFSAANNGQMPDLPSDLLPYLTTPAQQAALQRLTGGAPPK